MKIPASIAGAAAAAIVTLAMGPVVIGASSFSDSDNKFTEAQETRSALVAEDALLKQQLSEAQAAVKSLTDSLTVANGDAEAFRKEAAALKLQMEALGVDGLSGDRGKLEQRLLKAVRDLQLLQAERDRMADELVQLSESIMRYTRSASSEDDEARALVEARLRSASEALGLAGEGEGTGSGPVNLTQAMVISVKEEYSLIVANVGSLHGVKVGMPFQVIRDGKQIGVVRAVDVREKICGAVIQSLDTEQNLIKVGDRLKVDAR